MFSVRIYAVLRAKRSVFVSSEAYTVCDTLSLSGKLPHHFTMSLKRFTVFFLFTLLTLSIYALSKAELLMPAYYGDGMVFQRGKPLQIVGRTVPGASVEVSFDGRIRRVKADKNGEWRATFEKREAGGPYVLDIKTDNASLSYSDVWVGELWLCSGQSNMEFCLKDCVTADEDLPTANVVAPRLHLYNMEVISPTDGSVWNNETLSLVNEHRYFRTAHWQRATQDEAVRFSAIAYHFGRILADSLGVHVGLILNAVGGSPTESWTNQKELLESFPEMSVPWETNNLIQDWVRERAQHNCGGLKSDRQAHPYHIGYLFESGICPLEGLQPAGVIWYQGESNAHNIEAHERIFPLMVESWRNFFRSPHLPFFFVQLSSIASRETWPAFRDSQRRLLQIVPSTYMVVSSDLGDSLDVHPRRKRPIGERLARAALVVNYGRLFIPFGPEVERVYTKDSALCVVFRYSEGLRAADGGNLQGFEVSDTLGRYYPAFAEVKGISVWLTSPKVTVPQGVRYGWKPFTNANLVNGDGLPASTFRYPEED